jgi:TonB family protein
VSLAKMQQWTMNLIAGLLALTLGSAMVGTYAVAAQDSKAHDAVAHEAAVHEETKHDETKSDELTRKAKIKVSPVYPEIARRMSITGTVRLSVVVAPNGTVKSSKAVGGHPMLVNAAQDAMRQWRFEPAVAESSGIVEFKFQPQE